jgi:DNA-binding SARP family transcriptional activator
VHIAVIGRLQVHYQPATGEPVDLTEALAPRQCDIVVYLALHPDGVRRETLTAALWPDAPGDRPYNSFHATLSQMRRAIRKATDNHVDTLTVSQDGYYALHPDVVDLDMWHMNDALHARRHAATERERTAALHQIAQLYRGDLAETVNGDWIDAPREALRRDVLDVLAGLIRIVRENDPEHTLELLEQARHLDPHNEAIYRDIIRAQAQLGYHDSIPRTLSLLRTALAEVDTEPTASTLALATEMQSTDTPASMRTPRTRSGRPSSNAAVPPRPRQSGQNGA